MSAEKFGDIATEYPALHRAYTKVYSSALASKERGDDSLDYISGKQYVYCGPGSIFTEVDAERIRLTHLKFKNAVMYFLNVNRKGRRIPKLRDLLESVVSEKRKEQLKKRERIKKMSIEDIADTRDYLDDDQFDNLR